MHLEIGSLEYLDVPKVKKALKTDGDMSKVLRTKYKRDNLSLKINNTNEDRLIRTHLLK